MPDERVRAAIANWAPRFVAQGVDYNDFVRTTSGIERWDQWLEAWVATAEMHAELARDAERRGRTRTAGEAYVRAALCYHFAKFVWMLDMQRYREAADKAVASLSAAHRLLDPTAQRVEVSFDGTTMVANLRRPAAPARPPLALLLPGLDSTKERSSSGGTAFSPAGL